MTVHFDIGARKPQQQLSQHSVWPAPSVGMDARRPAAEGTQDFSILQINMMATEYGIRVRRGYREWQIGMPSAVRTVVPYRGPDGTNRLFVATRSGIYEVTTASAAPILKYTFATQDAGSGYGMFQHYVTQAGNGALFYADQSNGLFTYDPDGNTWTLATNITSAAGSLSTLNVANVVQIVHHKLRLWMVEKNTNKGWYLGVDAVQGEAQEFFFGRNFRRGGDLVGLYNWTVDGGAGRDDNLVAVSRSGDVIPYTGDDPSSANTWTMTGNYFVGEMPSGNQCVSEYGGDMYILSCLGLVSMRELMSGVAVGDGSQTLGFRVARLLREDLRALKDQRGWQFRYNPNEGLLIVNIPFTGSRYRQYIYNMDQGGWALWRDVPMLCCDMYDNVLYFGTEDGRVCSMDVSADNVQIDTAQPSTPVSWFVLTAFSDMGQPAVNKRLGFVRPNFIAQQPPGYTIQTQFDYDVGEPLAPVVSVTSNNLAVWDTALWDSAFWVGEEGSPNFKLLGGANMGRAVAIAMAGTSKTETFFTGWDISWTTGGFL